MGAVRSKHGLLGSTTTSAAYIRIQNGIAERKQQPHSAGRHPDAASAGQYQRLVLVVRGARHTIEIDNYIPLRNSRFVGEKPNVTHVRVFGCKAYATINHPVTKMAERAPLGVYLGRHEKQSAYILRIIVRIIAQL